MKPKIVSFPRPVPAKWAQEKQGKNIVHDNCKLGNDADQSNLSQTQYNTKHKHTKC